MSEARAQLRILLQRAAELRAESDEIQRKLFQIWAEVSKLNMRNARYREGLGPRDHRGYPLKKPSK